MKISVAVATYNGEKYIEEQLRSIIAQTRPVDEVIISDDQSTDRTRGIIETFIREHALPWKLITNPEKGLFQNFYHAIQGTSGDLVLLCDQDDRWLADKVERIENVFRLHPEVLCLNTSFSYIDDNGDPIAVEQRKNYANNNLIKGTIEQDGIVQVPLSDVFCKNISPGMTMAVTRKIIDMYLEHSEKKYIHDWEINCMAALVDGLYFYNAVLTEYRIHRGQAVSIASIKKETIFSKLTRKAQQCRNSLGQQLDLLYELKSICTDPTKTACLEKAVCFYTLRKAVALQRHRFKWLKEWIECHRFGRDWNFDKRYCFIDLLASFIK